MDPLEDNHRSAPEPFEPFICKPFDRFVMRGKPGISVQPYVENDEILPQYDVVGEEVGNRVKQIPTFQRLAHLGLQYPQKIDHCPVCVVADNADIVCRDESIWRRMHIDPFADGAKNIVASASWHDLRLHVLGEMLGSEFGNKSLKRNYLRQNQTQQHRADKRAL